MAQGQATGLLPAVHYTPTTVREIPELVSPSESARDRLPGSRHPVTREMVAFQPQRRFWRLSSGSCKAGLNI